MYGQKSGDIIDRRLLIDFLNEKLKRVYAEKGYLQYSPDFEPTFIEPEIEGQDGIVNFIITIDEGHSFKLSKLQFVGVDDAKAKELRGLINLKDGETFNQIEFEKGIERINQMSEFEFIDVDKTCEFRTNEETGEVAVSIELKKLSY
jgi:outer membrane protein assembly factor BamA